MILLDTHVLVWWTTAEDRLSPVHSRLIAEGEPDGIAASAFSVWEVAMLISKNRLTMKESSQEWLDRVSSIPTLHLFPVTPQILVDSTQLPGEFHPDPADRIIVATALALGSTLLTTDAKILAYPHVRSTGPHATP